MTVTVVRGTNLVEHHQDVPLTLLNESFEVHADTSEFCFAASVTGGANFSLALETNFNGSANWFTIDTSKTINADGQYIYFYSGKPVNRIRMRIDSISSGTPSVLPHIGVAYHG
jgi:hypothetical protein